MKQRLVGTLVLGSLALILIPLLLDGEGVERPPLSANVPPAPVIDTTPLPEPERPEIPADSLPSDVSATADIATDDPAADTDPALAPTDSAASDPAIADAALATDTGVPPDTTSPPEPAASTAVSDAEPAVQSAEKPALDASGLPEAWTVRLGSFGNRANAEALVTRLVTAGHKAYIRPVTTGQGTLSGVFVGPVATRNEATALQNELKSRFQIADALVQRYDVAE